MSVYNEYVYNYQKTTSIPKASVVSEGERVSRSFVSCRAGVYDVFSGSDVS